MVSRRQSQLDLTCEVRIEPLREPESKGRSRAGFPELTETFICIEGPKIDVSTELSF